MADEITGEMPNPAEGEKPEAQKEPTTAELLAQLDETRKALKAANKEAADRRKKLDAFEQAETERKTAEMTEAQKLQARLEKLEAEKNDALAKAAANLKRAAILSKAGGFIDPDDVVGALAGKLEINDAGQVEGLDEALKELGKAKPHWLKQEKGAPRLNAGNPGNANGDGETEAQRRARIYGGGSSLFDSNAQGRGGGVILSGKDNSTIT